MPCPRLPCPSAPKRLPPRCKSPAFPALAAAAPAVASAELPKPRSRSRSSLWPGVTLSSLSRAQFSRPTNASHDRLPGPRRPPARPPTRRPAHPAWPRPLRHRHRQRGLCWRSHPYREWQCQTVPGSSFRQEVGRSLCTRLHRRPCTSNRRRLLCQSRRRARYPQPGEPECYRFSFSETDLGYGKRCFSNAKGLLLLLSS